MDHPTRPRARSVDYVLLSLLATPLGGCLERELKPLNPCLVSGVTAEVSADRIDKVDLLFMVDNSSSMQEEQASLEREFPELIRVLTSGDRDGDGTQDFPPATDLHIGVVSSDLGLPGVHDYEGCSGLGDDGRLRSNAAPGAMQCSASTFNPPFLSYRKANGDDAEQLIRDFSCLALLGTEGCGFEQPLESVLKAVWPGSDALVRFVPDPATGFGQTGNAGPGFPNGDFIRNDPNDPSLIAIVLVTDEEDCSSNNLGHFPLGASAEGPNTRCFFEGQRPEPNRLFDVQRYIDTLKALRPGRENLVIFAGIVGVPPELVTRQARDGFDFNTAAGSDAFFDGLLAAPDMQERLDDRGTADPSDDNLVPSCDRGPNAEAFPPRRIVEVAKGFGINGVIQSICQQNFRPAMDAIVDTIIAQLDPVCLPRPLVRDRDGLVDCDVIWELPATQAGDAPTECSERTFLSVPDRGRPARTVDGRAACKVAQLAVVDRDTPSPDGETKAAVATMSEGVLFDQGWYYDEFSKQTEIDCRNQADKQRITFTALAEPPKGVKVKLECLNETQGLASTRTDVDPTKEQPSVGDPCDGALLRGSEVSGDDACLVLLAQPVNGSLEDRSMFCHGESRVCVQACATDADCPAAWVCDTRQDSVTAAGRPFCTNPTCGASQDP